MTLKLLKIEEGLGRGETIFHALQNRSDEQKESLRKRFHDREERRKQNRETQEANVRRKEKAKQDKLLAKRARYQEDGPAEEGQDGDRIEDRSDTDGEAGEFEDVDEFTPAAPVRAAPKPKKRVKRN